MLFKNIESPPVKPVDKAEHVNEDNEDDVIITREMNEGCPI